MWKNWEKLCEMNVNNYNEHPIRHGILASAILAVGVVVAVVGSNKLEEQATRK